ncbi:MAG: PQQ-binding-like beta-propeller repeat protein [Bryobacteraceae bacterium]
MSVFLAHSCGQPAVVGSCSGNFYALDRDTGRVRWSYDIKQDGNQNSFHGDPLVTGDLILIGTDAGRQGHVYAFERTMGKVRWKYLAWSGVADDVGVASDIVRRGKYVYAVAQGDELLCLNLTDGSVLWTFSSKFDRKKFAWSNSPVLEGNLVLFGGLDGRVYAIHADSGKVVWQTDLHSPISTTPAISHGSIYVGSKDNHFYRLQLNDGAVISSIALDGLPWWHINIVGNSLLTFLYHPARRVAGKTFEPSDIVSIDLDLKRVQWVRKCPDDSDPWTSARPYVFKGDVLVGDDRGKLFALHHNDGSIAWSHQFPSRVIRGIGESNGTLYVGTIHGMVYAFLPGK